MASSGQSAVPQLDWRQPGHLIVSFGLQPQLAILVSRPIQGSLLRVLDLAAQDICSQTAASGIERANRSLMAIESPVRDRALLKIKKQATLSPLGKPSVLIVEETELLRRHLRELLLKLGMEICESGDRGSAFRELKSRAFKLVITGIPLRCDRSPAAALPRAVQTARIGEHSVD